MENNNPNYGIINNLVDKQLNDPQGIRMADSTTFVYRFLLSPEEASALSLPETTPQADITLDLMMEFMTVIGLDAAGNKIADGLYPTDIKGPFIRRIFDLYGQKVKAQKEASAQQTDDAACAKPETQTAAQKVSEALAQIPMEDLLANTTGIPTGISPAESFTGEEPLTLFMKSESAKQIRRFYLNYPACDKEGKELHLYIETEVDEDDPSYLNYWVGCEEYTAKRYIASCQAPLEQENPLEIVKVKHLYFYIDEITKQK